MTLPSDVFRALGCLWHYAEHVPGIRLAVHEIREHAPKTSTALDRLPGADQGWLSTMVEIAKDNMPPAYQQAAEILNALAEDLKAGKK